MGLDMYLYRKHYIWRNDRDKIKELPVPVKPENVCYIVEEVAYWRKANQIHNWFVQNVQGGEDDCGNYYVEKEKLIELRDLCKLILDIKEKEPDKEKMKELVLENLPPTRGFFFGSTHVDEWYWEDIKTTYDTLNELLMQGIDADFEYYSSW